MKQCLVFKFRPVWIDEKKFHRVIFGTRCKKNDRNQQRPVKAALTQAEGRIRRNY
jgi:hypothetical protein